MNAIDILDLARDQSYTTEDDFNNTIGLKYLNIVKNDFFSHLITAVDENFHWDYFTDDLVIGQDEYLFPAVASDSEGLLKIKELYINYENDKYDNGLDRYIPAKLISQSKLTKDWNYYKTYQDKANPIYFIADKSVFIAPAPTKIGKIQARGIRNIEDYTESTTEQEMRIPVTYQHILIQ
jgi:hypothetical protein